MLNIGLDFARHVFWLLLSLAYVLLTSKTPDLYTRVLQKNFSIGTSELVMIDFERAELNAFKNIFSYINVHGCWFHYSRSLWRYLQSTELQNLFKNNKTFHKVIKCFITLPFAKKDVFTYYNTLIFYFLGKSTF